MPHSFFNWVLILILASLFEIGCQADSEDVEEMLTLEQQLAGHWQLGALDAAIQLDGEDYIVYLTQFADSFGLTPEEAALGLIFLEARISQEILDRDLELDFMGDNSFSFQQSEVDSLKGIWQLSEDDQELQLTSEADELLTFTIVSLEKTEMILHLEEHSEDAFLLPDLPQQLSFQFEMEWIKATLDQE